MNVSIEIKDVSGTLATIDDISYEFVKEYLINQIIKSETIIVWKFKNKDIILNMRNIVNIVVKKE